MHSYESNAVHAPVTGNANLVMSYRPRKIDHRPHFCLAASSFCQWKPALRIPMQKIGRVESSSFRTSFSRYWIGTQAQNLCQSFRCLKIDLISRIQRLRQPHLATPLQWIRLALFVYKSCDLPLIVLVWIACYLLGTWLLVPAPCFVACGTTRNIQLILDFVSSSSLVGDVVR